MKRSIYDKLEDIPEADRADYELQNGKYVLQLDGAHPVQLKNTELLGEKQTAQNAHQIALSQKDAEIQRISGELQTAKSQSGLPAGQVAIAQDELTLLNNFKALGEFDEVKKRAEEYPTLKEKEESAARAKILTDAAEKHGLNALSFIPLAEQLKLSEKLTAQETDDGKGNKKTEYFVKGKNTDGTDTSTVLSEFVKNNDTFKPFLNSLYLSDDDKNKLNIPNQGHGDPPSDKNEAESYINSTYATPGQKEDAKT